METRGCLSPMSAMRKQGAPLDFQKGFVENIQKIKNGLCPSPPPFRRSLLLEQKNRTRYAPHQSTTLTASPQGEAFFAYIYLCYTILLLIFVKMSSSTRYYVLTLIIFSIINFYNMFIGAKNVDSRNYNSHKPDANRSKFVRT